MTEFGLFSSIYRVAELADGWNGRIISTQVYFSKSRSYSQYVSLGLRYRQTCSTA